MAKEIINVGTTANDSQGDSLRAAFTKINTNFSELYTALGLDSAPLNLGAFEFTGSTLSTTDSSSIVIDQATTISSNLTVGGDILPSVNLGGSLGSPTRQFRSLYVSTNTIYINNVPLSIDPNNNLTINGNQLAGGASDRLVAADNDLVLDSEGGLTYRGEALQKASGVVTCAGNGSTIVYTAAGQLQHAIRLLILVEGFEGASETWDTQSCEMIIAKSFRGNTVAATVYGIVHTSSEPLATFTAEWNASVSRVDVVCTTPSANSVDVKTFATEITTSD
jgi:hypothetical protein